MLVPNFEAISRVTFGFRTRKTAPKVCRKKPSQSKTAQVRQKYFRQLYVLRYLFIPTNPLLAAMCFFFFFFFLPKSCSLSPKSTKRTAEI